jgi:MFS family permease
VAFTAVGAGYIAVLSGLNTVVQLRAPAAVRGRVLGIYMVGLGIVYPIGAVLQGLIADHIGVRAVTVLGAVILLAALTGIAVVRPAVFGALGDPSSATEVTVVVPTGERP